MAFALPPAPPLFCLGGNLYPVDASFDWSSDRDVLVDAIRETHVAMRHHHFATLTPDRDWLDCECVDPADHRDLLVMGHFALVNRALSMEPDVGVKRGRSLPFNGIFLRVVQAVAFLVGTVSIDALV